MDWITKRFPFDDDNPYFQFLNGRFVCTSRSFSLQTNLFCVTTNGLDWSATPIPFGATFVFTDGFYRGGGNPRIKSSNGIDWETDAGLPDGVSNPVWLNGVYIGVPFDPTGAQNGNILTSTDGKTWQTNLPPPSLRGELPTPRVSGDSFVLTLGKEFFLTSRDGVNWVDHQVAIGSQYKVSSVAFGPVSAVAVVNNFSPDLKRTPNKGEVFQSKPFESAIPAALEPTIGPVVVLKDGEIGSPYRIESASKPQGPWARVAVVYPASFPFYWTNPAGQRADQFYRAVLE